jgi:hypothetical protein
MDYKPPHDVTKFVNHQHQHQHQHSQPTDFQQPTIIVGHVSSIRPFFAFRDPASLFSPSKGMWEAQYFQVIRLKMVVVTADHFH